MADRPVRPRHRPGAKRIDPEPVGNPQTPRTESPLREEAPESPRVPGTAEGTGAPETRVPRQGRPRTAPESAEAWHPHPRGLAAREVHDRWNEAQGEFVDDPPGSVREADALATEVADAVIAEIEARRAALRTAWDNDGGDTEALRLALRDYRAFVRRLAGGGRS